MVPVPFCFLGILGKMLKPPLRMSVLWLADPERGCETDREEEQFLHFSPICVACSVWAGGLEPAAAEEM